MSNPSANHNIHLLIPPQNYQQPLDITVREGEEVYLQVDGTHDVFVTGNYIAFPEEDDEDDEDDYSEEDYDLSGDEDELELDEMDQSEDELDELENPRITEVDSEEEAPKLVESKKGKKNNKRAAEEAESLDDLISKAATNGDAKAAKKVKKNDGQAVAAAAEPAKKADTPTSDKKKVQFSKNLEMGPTGSPRVDEKKEAAKPAAKGPRNVSGVTVDDKKEGKGKAAKKGDRVEMRYIGKLKNGKVFDCTFPFHHHHHLSLHNLPNTPLIIESYTDSIQPTRRASPSPSSSASARSSRVGTSASPA